MLFFHSSFLWVRGIALRSRPSFFLLLVSVRWKTGSLASGSPPHRGPRLPFSLAWFFSLSRSSGALRRPVLDRSCRPKRCGQTRGADCRCRQRELSRGAGLDSNRPFLVSLKIDTPHPYLSRTGFQKQRVQTLYQSTTLSLLERTGYLPMPPRAFPCLDPRCYAW